MTLAPQDWIAGLEKGLAVIEAFDVDVEQIQTSAFCDPRAARWRSTALWQRFVSPPANHDRNGGFE